MREEGKEKYEKFLRNETIEPATATNYGWIILHTYRECVPYHLAVHELVANIAPYESPGWNELHT